MTYVSLSYMHRNVELYHSLRVVGHSRNWAPIVGETHDMIECVQNCMIWVCMIVKEKSTA
jgi:hypothetical protein